jgi:predicted nuclease of restriction endonuclease-like (RecB) superfamily
MAPVDNNSFVSDIKQLIEHSRRTAYAAVNSIMIDTYWHIGQRIVEQEQQGEKRAEYGKQIIKMLSKELTQEYGEGWSERNLRNFRSFYLAFNDLEIWHTRVPNLTWSHIRTTLRVDDPVAARWYLQTASQEMWSVRTLDRNISTQYFERHFKQPQLVEDSRKNPPADKLEVLKSPVVAELLGFNPGTDYTERDLQKGLITHLQ